MSEFIGPDLPAHLLTKSKSEAENPKIIGPALPPHLLHKLQSQNVSSSASDNDNNDDNELKIVHTTETESSSIGPSLPFHLINTLKTETNKDESSETVTPSKLEDEFLSTNNECENSESSADASYGPALPPHLQKAPVQDDSDEEDAYGPLPPGVAASSHAYQALEERALQIKLGQLDSTDDKATVREEWMMELPDVHARNLGLGPRQFRKNERPDFSDRSSWTDTPELKAKKAQGKIETKVDLKKEAELREIEKRDDEQKRLAEKHNRKKKRDKSLMELHQEKLKKQKKEVEEEGGPTRRPFNREIDLQVNRFDEAQKKSIMKKAMHLDDRFSRGQSKFL